MNAKEMLDKVVKIIARQDVDRELALFFMNTAIRAVLRDRDITRFYKYVTNVSVAGGVIDIVTNKLKSAKHIEYGTGANKRPLAKFAEYNEARQYYPDFSVTGEPRHYLELGTSILVLPVPVSGEINIVGEVWPDDLTDSFTSTDITTIEIPEAWIYLAAAEYLDYFDEMDKGNYWRQKGTLLVDKYIDQLNAQAAHGVNSTVSSYFASPSGRSDY